MRSSVSPRVCPANRRPAALSRGEVYWSRRSAGKNENEVNSGEYLFTSRLASTSDVGPSSPPSSMAKRPVVRTAVTALVASGRTSRSLKALRPVHSAAMASSSRFCVIAGGL